MLVLGKVRYHGRQGWQSEGRIPVRARLHNDVWGASTRRKLLPGSPAHVTHVKPLQVQHVFWLMMVGVSFTILWVCKHFQLDGLNKVDYLELLTFRMRRSQWRLHLLSVASEADLPRTSEMHGSQKTELTGAVDERKYTEEQEVRQMQRRLTDLKGKLSAVQAAAAKIGAVARGSATRWKAWPCFGERREVSAAVLLHTLLLCDSVKVKQDYHEARAAVEADVIWAVVI